MVGEKFANILRPNLFKGRFKELTSPFTWKEKLMKILPPVITLIVICAGCAMDPNPSNVEPREEKDYVTGSMIPKRDRDAATTGIKSVDPQAVRDAIGKGTAAPGGSGAKP